MRNRNKRLRRIGLGRFACLMVGVLCLVFYAVSSPASLEATAYISKPELPSPLTVIKEAFQERNRKIETVRILEAKRPDIGASRYLVVAWGIRKDYKFEGQFEDELFGLFVMDESLTKIERTLDIFATPRWFDYQLNIESSSIDEVTIVGKGKTYGDQEMRRTYKLTNDR